MNPLTYLRSEQLIYQILERLGIVDIDWYPPDIDPNMLLINTFHIVFVVTWFAGLFNLSRLFVYHTKIEDEISKVQFKAMEHKLYSGITTPSAVLALGTGLWLWLGYDYDGLWYDYEGLWLTYKLLLVLPLVIYQLWCWRYLAKFKTDCNIRSHTFFKFFSQFPLVFLITIVALAVFKPDPTNVALDELSLTSNNILNVEQNLKAVVKTVTKPHSIKLLISTFHIVFVVTWFAGLLYLPRLFVYHAQTKNEVSSIRFKVMERKLYFGIATPSAVLTLGTGLWLWLGYGNEGLWLGYGNEGLWLTNKLLLVLILVIYHLWSWRYLANFKFDRNNRPLTFFKFYGKLPLLFLFAIVALAVFEPDPNVEQAVEQVVEEIVEQVVVQDAVQSVEETAQAVEQAVQDLVQAVQDLVQDVD